MKRRFPWWAYALAALFICGGISSIFRNPQSGANTTNRVSAVSTATSIPDSARRGTEPIGEPAAAQNLQENTPNSQPQLIEAQVTNVVDGDTLDVLINGKQYRIRIIGVDTPETKHPSQPVMCFGVEATQKTQELIALADSQVLLEKDVSETDRYDRLLRYVWLKHPDGTRMLNEELVKWGYAQVSTYPPDVKYQELFLASQREAREQSRGLWAACGEFGVPASIPTPIPAPTAASRPPAPPTATTPAAVQPPAQTGGVEITYVYYDGKERQTEGDEYAVVTNNTNAPVNLRGYLLNAGDNGQDFYFPSFVLGPGENVRVYTNRNISGTFSFDYGRAIWNNNGDCGYLYNSDGNEISEYCY